MHRFVAIVLPLFAVAVLGCGRVAPTVAPGTLTVESDPPGAAILLDGIPSGFVTPHTFGDLPAGQYVVTVDLAGHAATTPPDTVTVTAGGRAGATFALSATVLEVDSSPRGASIIIDGADTGQVTPAAIGGLSGDTVQLTLVLANHVATPAALMVDLTPGETTTVEAGTVAFRPQRTVLLEGFSNVDCDPCPELAENLVTLAADPEFGPDRFLFVEYSVNWPNTTDPLYLGNPTENAARYTEYFVLGAPALYVDGEQLAVATDEVAMESAIRDGWTDDPGFFLDVSADLTAATIQVGITVDARREIDLGDFVVHAVLYEREVVFPTAPGDNGQSVFHHVFRDRADAPASVGAVSPGSPAVVSAELNREGRDPDNLVVVAFVQHPVDHTIIQAGSTAAPVGGNP